MQNLVRVSKADNLPFKKSTFYKWFHLGKYPEIFVKFGGLFVDLDRLAQAIDKSRPTESINAATKSRRSRKSGRIDMEPRGEVE
jgi:hypothetical protein